MALRCFDEINAWRASSNRERALLVVGDPGIGKSAFVAEKVHRNPDGQVLAYHICRADDPETLRRAEAAADPSGSIYLLSSSQMQEEVEVAIRIRRFSVAQES